MNAPALSPTQSSLARSQPLLLAASSPTANLAPHHSTCPLLASPSRARARRNDGGTFGPGDYGWGTDIVTTTLTTAVTNYDPEVATTVWTTWGVPRSSPATGGVVWITVYEGSETTHTLTPPQVVTYTLFPTSTSLETSTVVDAQTTYETHTALTTATLHESSTVVVVPPFSTASSSETLPTTPPPWLTLSSSTSTASRTRTTPSAEPTSTAVPSESDCRAGDEDEREPGRFRLTEDQSLTLFVAGIYAIGILISWTLWGIRHLLYPFKSLSVLLHESGHVLGILLSGQPLHRFTIDPNFGGATCTLSGRRLRPMGLFGGQVFSVVLGGVLVFTAFDTLASKYASFIIMALWLPVIGLQANALSMLLCVWPLALLIGVWFIDHARGLRFYILFVGVMSSFYIVWDTMDDFLHRKQNECCVVMLESNTAVPAFVWFLAWLLVALAVLAGCILGAVALFRQTEHGMFCRGQGFAPT